MIIIEIINNINNHSNPNLRKKITLKIIATTVIIE